MITLARFASPARQAVVRAGMLASEYGRDKLTAEFFLLALAEDQPLSKPVDLGVTAAMIGAEIQTRTPVRQDRELLAALGIDLDEVRRRAFGATFTHAEDPIRWQLHRSRVRPLRISLIGPAAEVVLDESARKVIEVAQWASRRGRRTLIEREHCSGVCSPMPPASRYTSSGGATSISIGSGQICSNGIKQRETGESLVSEGGNRRLIRGAIPVQYLKKVCVHTADRPVVILRYAFDKEKVCIL